MYHENLRRLQKDDTSLMAELHASTSGLKASFLSIFRSVFLLSFHWIPFVSCPDCRTDCDCTNQFLIRMFSNQSTPRKN